ncbi:hypothetical protein GCM10018962_52680 [Dactylosporangium matsuzakiense]
MYVARHPAVAAAAVWAAATPAPPSARVAAAIAPIFFFCMRLLTSQDDGPANGSAAGVQVQAVPLSVNALGAVSLDVHVPWNPNVVFAPGGMAPL